MGVVSSCFKIKDNELSGRWKHRASYESLASAEDAQVQCQPVREKTPTFTVLVTGFGAFPKKPGRGSDNGHYSEDDNTSHLVTTLLPSSLPPYSKYNSTPLNIKILNPTALPGHAVKTEYKYVRHYCSELWKAHGNSIDLILHLGMANVWEWYSIERSAWKEGTVKPIDADDDKEDDDAVEYYMLPDDIGETMKDLKGACPWGDDIPKQLFAGPGFDVDKLAKNVQLTLNAKMGRKAGDEIKVRPHADAGNYLCGFISYESFAQARSHEYSAKTIFCHVPGWKDKKRLKIGRDFVCTIIAEIAATENGFPS